MKPKRIQRRRTRGWRLPPNTLCVTRPGKFGNPFIGPDAVAAFREWLCLYSVGARRVATLFDVEMAPDFRQNWEGGMELLIYIHELRGKNLACWCTLDGSPCHADALLEFANREV